MAYNDEVINPYEEEDPYAATSLFEEEGSFAEDEVVNPYEEVVDPYEVSSQADEVINPYEDPVDPVDPYLELSKHLDEPEGIDDLIGGFAKSGLAGIQYTYGALRNAFNVYTGDNEDVIEQAYLSQGVEKTKESIAFMKEIEKGIEKGDVTLLDGLRNVVQAVQEEPLGAAHETVSQLPNSAAVMGSMYTGGKIGAAIGSFAGPPGSVAAGTVGAVTGGIIGLWAGNTSIETGFLAGGAVQETGTFTDEQRSEVTRQGAIKGSVITAIDTFTLGLSRLILGIPGRSVEKAINKSLTNAGVDIADEVAVKAALQTQDIMTEVAREGTRALAQTMSKAKRSARGMTSFSLESIGEASGEYLGSEAAGLGGSPTDALMEGMMSIPQSSFEVFFVKSTLTPGKNTRLVADQRAAGRVLDTPTIDDAINVAHQEAASASEKPFNPLDQVGGKADYNKATANKLAADLPADVLEQLNALPAEPTAAHIDLLDAIDAKYGESMSTLAEQYMNARNNEFQPAPTIVPPSVAPAVDEVLSTQGIVTPAPTAEANGRITTVYTVDTEDAGPLDIRFMRHPDGSVSLFDSSTSHVVEYNAEFAKDKQDEELLQYTYEPQGYTGSTSTEGSQSVKAETGTTPPAVPKKPRPEYKPTDLSIRELPIDKVKLSKDVPQFKEGANEEGVVEPLAGKFDRVGVSPILAWERENGDLEVVSGRHRLDLAKRSGETTIPGQVMKESEGFTLEHALTADAELNIRDNQGEVKDYANYFRNAGVTTEEAEERGLLSRSKGRQGITIASEGSTILFDSHQAGEVTDNQAAAIAKAAPNDEGLQTLGLAQAKEGRSIDEVVGTMQAVKAMAALEDGSTESIDMFGFDESSLKKAKAIAKRVAAKKRDIRENINAVKGAANRPDRAKALGVDVKDPEGIKARMKELQAESDALDNWATNPELRASLVGEDTFEVQTKPAEAVAEEEAAPVDDRTMGMFGDEEFSLETQTEESLAAEAEANKPEAAPQEVPSPDDFVMTGSDSAVDQAEARGQDNLFDQKADTTSDQELSDRLVSMGLTPAKDSDQKQAEIIANIEDETTPTMYQNTDGTLIYTVTPAVNSDKKYQVTVWDKDGPVSDSKHNTPAEIVRHYGYGSEFAESATKGDLDTLVAKEEDIDQEEGIDTPEQIEGERTALDNLVAPEGWVVDGTAEDVSDFEPVIFHGTKDDHDIQISISVRSDGLAFYDATTPDGEPLFEGYDLANVFVRAQEVLEARNEPDLPRGKSTADKDRHDDTKNKAARTASQKDKKLKSIFEALDKPDRSSAPFMEMYEGYTDALAGRPPKDFDRVSNSEMADFNFGYGGNGALSYYMTAYHAALNEDYFNAITVKPEAKEGFVTPLNDRLIRRSPSKGGPQGGQPGVNFLLDEVYAQNPKKSEGFGPNANALLNLIPALQDSGDTELVKKIQKAVKNREDDASLKDLVPHFTKLAGHGATPDPREEVTDEQALADAFESNDDQSIEEMHEWISRAYGEDKIPALLAHHINLAIASGVPEFKIALEINRLPPGKKDDFDVMTSIMRLKNEYKKEGGDTNEPSSGPGSDTEIGQTGQTGGGKKPARKSASYTFTREDQRIVRRRPNKKPWVNKNSAKQALRELGLEKTHRVVGYSNSGPFGREWWIEPKYNAFKFQYTQDEYSNTDDAKTQEYPYVIEPKWEEMGEAARSNLENALRRAGRQWDYRFTKKEGVLRFGVDEQRQFFIANAMNQENPFSSLYTKSILQESWKATEAKETDQERANRTGKSFITEAGEFIVPQEEARQEAAEDTEPKPKTAKTYDKLSPEEIAENQRVAREEAAALATEREAEAAKEKAFNDNRPTVARVDGVTARTEAKKRYDAIVEENNEADPYGMYKDDYVDAFIAGAQGQTEYKLHNSYLEAVSRSTRADKALATLIEDGYRDGMEYGGGAPETGGEAAPAKKHQIADFGTKNKVVSKTKAEEAIARIKARQTRLKSGIDPEDAVDAVIAATYFIEGGAIKFADYSVAMIDAMGEWIRPYLRQFYENVRWNPDMVEYQAQLDDGNTIEAYLKEVTANDERTAGVEESTGAGNAAPDTQGNLPDGERGGLGQGAVEAGQATSGQQGRPDNAVGEPGADLFGEQSDTSVSDEVRRLSESAAGGLDTGGGSVTSTTGLLAEQESDRVADSLIQETPASQPVATDVKPLSGDVANVKAQMPFLTEGQAEDVVFAEARFAKSDGYGVLFTNGTGTGKTFVGLGVIKRLWESGKKNILIAAPKQTIADAWIKAGKQFFGLNISRLESTQDPGRGIVVTTYANLGENRELISREWDAFVMDEAHYLAASKEGDYTKALKMLRALSYKRGTEWDRVYAKNAEDAARLEELPDLIKKAKKDINYSLADALEKEGTAIRDRLQPLVELERQILKERANETKPRSLLLSATPFAYEKTVRWANEFLFDWGVANTGQSQRYNAPDPYESFMQTHFGYRMRYNRLTAPEAEVDSGAMQRAFNSWLKKEGALSGRVLDSNFDYDRRFVLMDNAIGNRVDEALQWIRDQASQKNALDGISELNEMLKDSFDYHSRMYFLEALKARDVVKIIKQHLELGRKVAVFHDFKKGGVVNPFRIGENRSEEAFVVFKKEFSDLIESFDYIPSVIDTMQKAFPDAAIYNGDVSAKKRVQMQEDFQSDAPNSLKVLVAQADAAREGISLHDTTGVFQRVTLQIGLPVKPTSAIQLEGRTYRTGQASDAMFRYLTIGTAWERTAFASTIAQRASAAENLALGEQARGLKQSFIDAYEAAEEYPPGFDGEGSGGKELDAAYAQSLTPWDMAKTYYFGTKKQGRGRSAASREHSEYFATPEPLGLKMTQWADIRGADDVLEPSAGHGAIARFFPENANGTAIEYTNELSSKLSLHFDGKVITGDYMDHHISNKYDAIVMNPPFGAGGAQARDHVQRAMKHLRNGGRIVALVPTGPAADKKFEALMESEEAKGVYLVGEIQLPGVVFERAGTSVRTKVIVLERQNDPAVGMTLQQRVRDYTDAENINDFFDRIEDTDMGTRTETVVQTEATGQAAATALLSGREGRLPSAAPSATPTVPSGTPAAGALTMDSAHTKTGKPMYVVNLTYDMGDNYDAYNAAAKRSGGIYIRAKMRNFYKPTNGIAVQGKPTFSFSTEAGRAQFLNDIADTNETTSFSNIGPSTGPGMSVSAVEDVVRFAAARLNQELGITVNVVADPSAMPEEVRLKTKADTAGVYYQGNVYLFADRIKSARAARVVLAHELVGHKGVLEMSTAQEWADIKAEIENLMVSGGPLASSIGQEVRNRYGVAVEPETFYKEFMAIAAERAEKAGPLDSLWAKVKAVIRRFLKLYNLSVFSESEIAIILDNAKQYLRQTGGAGRSAEETLYSRIAAVAKLTREEIEEWRSIHKVSQRQGRVPEVKAAAKDLQAGRTTTEEYNKVVKHFMPVMPIQEVPGLTSTQDMSAALATNKAASLLGVDVEIAQGTRVASRLDIPAYDYYDTWVVTIHDGSKRGGSSIAYGNHAVMKNVEFVTNAKAALGIATGDTAKAPFARIHGDWQDVGGEGAHDMAKMVISDPAWVQVGMNPFRHSYFYDKATGAPVVAADTVVQIGPLVMAKNVKYASATDPRFQVGNTGVYFAVDTAPEFYSALALAARRLKQEKGTSAQMLGTLKGMPGVNPAELEWTGLVEYMAGMDGKVTKQEIVEYLEANGVQVETVTIGLTGIQGVARAEGYSVDFDMDGETLVFTDPDGEVVDDNNDLPQSILDSMEANSDMEGVTKYAQHTLPGGTNNREVLLTLPLRQNPKIPRKPLATNLDVLTEILERNNPVEFHYNGVFVKRFEELWEYNDIKSKIRSGDWNAEDVSYSTIEFWDTDKPNNNFASDHWKQPNVLAHVRLNDRVDANGKRVLLVEEIQSDWAQAGRKYGFSSAQGLADAPMKAVYSDGYWEVSTQEGRFITNVTPTDYLGDDAYGTDLYRQLTEEEAISVARERLRSDIDRTSAGKLVPAAPFVGKTSAWVELSVKKIMRLAAEGGYDSVAWTTGEQQADRYDLSKQVDSIQVWGDAKDGYHFEAFKDGKYLLGDKGTPITHSALADNIGKDLADRAVEDIKAGKEAKYSGDDLRVGGGGMIAFYDQIVPNAFKKVAKKLGGGKLSTVKVHTTDAVLSFEKWLLTSKNLHLVDIVGAENEWDYTVAYDSFLERAVFSEQPSVEITEEMKSQAMQGQALFSNTGQERPTRAAPQANFTQRRLERIEWDHYGSQGEGNHKVEATIAHINPLDFVYATTGTEDKFAQIQDEAQQGYLDALSDPKTIHLWVVPEGNGNFRITSHDGRHRMAALAAAGVESAPVLLVNKAAPDGATATGITEASKIFGQKLNEGDKFTETLIGMTVQISNPIDVTTENRTAINESFGRTDQGGFLYNRVGVQTRRDFLKDLGKLAVGLGVTGVIGNQISGPSFDGVPVGSAQAIPETILESDLSPEVVALLEANKLKEALQLTAETGPVELRELASTIVSLMPDTGIDVVVERNMPDSKDHGVAGNNKRGGVSVVLYTGDPENILGGLRHATFLHEGLHAILMARYRDLNTSLGSNFPRLGFSKPAAMEALDQFRSLYKEFNKAFAPGGQYAGLYDGEALWDPDEFFVRALTDPELQLAMSQAAYEGKTLWSRFKDWVQTQLFGFDKGVAPSWLDAAMLGAQDVLDVMGQDAADFQFTNAAFDFIQEERARMGLPFEDLRKANRRTRAGATDMTPAEQAVVDKGGFGIHHPVQNIVDRWKNFRANMGTRLHQGLVDQYRSFKDILGDDRAWMMGHLTKSSIGVIEAVVERGQPFLEDGAIGLDTSKKSLKQILEPLGEDLDRWTWWIAGNRAGKLKAEERENLFDDADIQVLKEMNRNTAENPNREALFEQARVEFEALGDAINRIAVETGLMNEEEVDRWMEEGFYLPFYRVMEEGLPNGPRVGGTAQLVRQQAYKHLKGGKDKLGDLLGNAILNWNHIIHASLNNQAARQALESAETLGYATRVTRRRKSKKAIYVRENGVEKWWEIDQSSEGKLVLESLMMLNTEGMRGYVMDSMRMFKRALTIGVTASPEFKIRNLIRDTLSAIAVTDMSTNIAKNLYSGMKATSQGSDADAQMLAGGAIFGDSGYHHGADPELIRHVIKKGVHRETILDSRFLIKKFWDKYQDFGARLENVNRAANYLEDIAKGRGRLEANFNARDHLDFSRQGSFVAIRFISQIVPFFNARLQGLDKLARASRETGKKGQFYAVVGAYSILSVLLYLMMRDDEDYKEAEDWERDTYHLFKVPGSDTMYRIPRPFEVGSIASTMERAVEQLVNDDVHGELFAERILHTLSETFSFNPMPQAIKPALEVAMDTNWFTGSPIEGMSLRSLSPVNRKRAWTSTTAIAMSEGMDAISWGKVVLSPVQIQHLVRGYFGWMGTTTLATADMFVTGPITGAPVAPAMRWTEYPIAKAFTRSGPNRNPKQIGLFYDRLGEISEAYADIRQASGEVKEGLDPRFDPKVQRIVAESGSKIALRREYNKVSKALSKINARMSQIQVDANMTAKEKRAEMDRLQIIKNDLTSMIDEKTKQAF